MGEMIDARELIRRQALPLIEKIRWAKERIWDFHDVFGGMIYISFSGGKDSTVLLHLVRSIFPQTEGVFVDTGLEYPEIKVFVRSIENITWLKPKMPFNKVVDKYGYPIISKETASKIDEIRNTKSDYLRNKRLFGDANGNGKISDKWKYLIDAPFKISARCCSVMKKSPLRIYETKTKKRPLIGTMAIESSLRKMAYLKNGCNALDGLHPHSQPLSFWLEKDIWEYIKINNLKYSKIYDMGYDRTGCMFCMFGVTHDASDLFSKNRFEKMKETHPKEYNYCINKLGCGKVLDYINVNY